MMRGIRSRDTRPERVVRSWLHAHGYRFRLGRKDLPGSPDIVLPRYHVAIFVNGCFWHRHAGCKNAVVPRTRTNWWMSKFARNVVRDAHATRALRRMGWVVVVVWECRIRRDNYGPALHRRLTGLQAE
jgi:DNA mismatch endonuclease (patch repair protein)